MMRKLNDYLAAFPELKVLYSMVEQEYIERGLIHHNWQHNLRDLARGVSVGEAERANIKIILAAILLHDIGRLHPIAGQDHHTAGAAVAPGFLREAGFSQQEIDEICHCIKAHGPRGNEEPATLAAKVCYDVAVLSCSVGFSGAARVFDYFMREEKLGVKQMLEMPGGEIESRQDFYTKTGKSMGISGFKKAADFWQELRNEYYKEETDIREIIADYEGD